MIMAFETTSTTAAHTVSCDVCGAREHSVTDGFGAPVYPEGWKLVQLEWAPPVAHGASRPWSPPGTPPPPPQRYPDEVEPYGGAGPQWTEQVERPNLNYHPPDGYYLRGTEPKTRMITVIRVGAGRIRGDVCPRCQQNLTLASIMEVFELRRQQAAPAQPTLPQGQQQAPPPQPAPPWRT